MQQALRAVRTPGGESGRASQTVGPGVPRMGVPGSSGPVNFRL